MIRMLLPQRRISCVIWMFQESLFRQKPWRSTTVWPAARDVQSRTDSGTPSHVVTTWLQVSDRRAPGIRLRLHRVGGVCGVTALLPRHRSVWGATIPGHLSLRRCAGCPSSFLSSCGQVARFVEVVWGDVYLDCVLPHLEDDLEKQQLAQSENNQVAEHRLCPV